MQEKISIISFFKARLNKKDNIIKGFSHYILDYKHRPQLCENLLKSAMRLENSDKRRVKLSNINEIRINTVFLGIDHRFSGDKPVLFETMIFDEKEITDLNDYYYRYCTWRETVYGHGQAVKLVRNS